MKKCVVVPLFVAVLSICAQVHAQFPGSRTFGLGTERTLLTYAAVQEELGFTAAQKEKYEAVRLRPGEFKGLSPDELAKKESEHHRATANFVTTELDAKQQQRLAELRIQYEGTFNVLNNAEMAEKLVLTQAQRQEIREIVRAHARTPDPPASATPEERKKARMEFRGKAVAMMLAALTESQRTEFERLRGAKLDLPFNLGP